MKRILLIEDNASNRLLIGDHLRRVGYEVCEHETADDALAQALEEHFDLVVMDIQLPGTDGLVAARLLRKQPSTKDVPILAVTALAMRQDEFRVREAGCTEYVSKPIAYKDFLATVERLLNAGSPPTSAA